MDHKLYKGPEGTALRFFERATRNNFASEKAGHPVYDNCLFVEVIVPGSTESMPEFMVERTLHGEETAKPTSHYAKYREAIEAYKSQSDAGSIQGTPLGEWPQINAGQVQTFKGMNVHTVEQLAQVSDSSLGGLGIGARNLREQAKQWLSTRAFGVPTAQMQSELDAAKARVQQLETQVSELQSALARSSTPNQPESQPEPVPQEHADEALAKEPTVQDIDGGDPFGNLTGGSEAVI